MISSEGGNGYNSGEWYSTTASTDVVSGCYKFVLDWSNAQTYGDGERCRKADTDNTDQTTTGAKYLYYGDPAVCKKFYDKGNGIYELTVDFSSPWGS